MPSPPAPLAAALDMIAGGGDEAALRGAVVALAEAGILAERHGERAAADGFVAVTRALRARLAPPAAAGAIAIPPVL